MLYVTAFKYSLRSFSVTALRKITTDFSDDIHYLHACRLKFTINANIVDIAVEATFSKSIVCPNHHGQYFDS